MNDRRVCFGLAVLAAVAVGMLVWVWASKDANTARAELRDSLAAAHAVEAGRIVEELGESLGAITALENALGDSTRAWAARERQARAGQREAERTGADIAARLRATLDSVGQVMVDSLEASADARVEAVKVVAERWQVEAEAQQQRGDSLSAALFRSMAASDEWEAAYTEQRIASETKDAIIRSTKLQRNATSVVTLASLALNVVQAVR